MAFRESPVKDMCYTCRQMWLAVNTPIAILRRCPVVLRNKKKNS